MYTSGNIFHSTKILQKIRVSKLILFDSVNDSNGSESQNNRPDMTELLVVFTSGKDNKKASQPAVLCIFHIQFHLCPPPQ
jgi:hypothetical protein